MASVLPVPVFFGILLLITPSGSQDQLLTVKDTLASTSGLTEFNKLFLNSNVDRQLSPTGSYTIFALNDTAFEYMDPQVKNKIMSWPPGSDQLQDFIKFHIISGNSLKSSSIGDFMQYNSMANNNLKLYLNKRDKTSSSQSGVFGPTVFYVNGAEIDDRKRDLTAANGVIHGVGYYFRQTSVKTGRGYMQNADDPNVHIREFYNLVTTYLGGKYAGTYDLFNQGSVTLFVPSDSAINNVPATMLRNLQGDATKLNEVVMAHIIPNRVLFTHYVNKNDGYKSYGNWNVRFRQPVTDIRNMTTYVNSNGVDGKIIHADIPIANGVIHVVDTVLGYAYYTVRTLISRNAQQFENYINKVSEEIRSKLVTSNDINVFVPEDAAFSKLYGVPGGLDDIGVLDKVMRLHILRDSINLDLSAKVGGYESREFRPTLRERYNITIYNDRDELWVQAGLVKARVLRPDVSGTNGKIHIIDAVLGVPYRDLPNEICSDLWLLRTYDFIRSVGMTRYISDRSFSSQRCDFEMFGYPLNYDYYMAENQNMNTQGTQNTIPITTKYNMGACSYDCDFFTFFVPNSTYMNAFQSTLIGYKIMQDTQRLQYLFKRLLFKDRIVLGELANTNYVFTAMTGEKVVILKSMDRDFRIQFSGVTANVIQADVGGTNGVFHIIDRFLYTNNDLYIDINPAASPSQSLLLLISLLFLSLFFYVKH